MGKITQLSKHISELIAAGEVVERPSSVIKELVENSIDAQASEITVEINNGGITYIRVTDNGIGMSKDDAVLSFNRHATSKISSQDDLYSIRTLGFRGEALCAITAVSKAELRTCTSDDEFGTFVKISGGEILDVGECATLKGTTLIIRDIFYNVPARMKFLKKDSSEGNYVNSILQKIAVSYPEISFKFIRDSKEIFSTLGNGDLLETIYSVYGKEFSNAFDVCYEYSDVIVSGYISKLDGVRGNRMMQLFFVNGRYVKSPLLQAAIEQSYRNNIPGGKFPFCVLNINISYEHVDVNVHPTKTEIKFHNDKTVFNAVYVACKNAIESQSIAEEKPMVKEIVEDNITENQQKINADVYKININPQDEYVKKEIFTEKFRKVDINIETDDDFVYNEEKTLNSDNIKQPYNIAEAKEETVFMQTSSYKNYADVLENNILFEDIRVIGECFGTYIIAQKNEELLLVDKHAAHEKIIFNEIRATFNEGISQMLLSPQIINLGSEEFSIIFENIEIINKLGFDIEIFGADSIVVREIPSLLDKNDVKTLIYEIIDNINKNYVAYSDKTDKIIHSIACRAAIKANHNTSLLETENLVKKVLSDKNLECCPHGRPITIKYTKKDFEKMFKRTGHS